MKIKELYKIVEGSNVWNLTSSDTSETYGGDTYLPAAIGRTEVEVKNELSRANIELNFGIDNTIARRWLNDVVDSNVTLTVWTKQDAAYLVVWKGRLSGVKPEDSIIKLVFESIFTSLRRPGLRLRYQRTCPHVLYGRGCRLNKNDWDIAGTATAVVGDVVTVAAAAGYTAGWFNGGMLEAPDGTLRFITNHVGNQVTLIRPILSLNTAIIGGAQAVKLYPGCDRTAGVCDGKFNNLPNNGSFRFIPIRNPFTGNSFV